MSARETDTCARCEHSRQHHQLGAFGLYCHEDSPKIQLMPGQVAGTMQLFGVWPPVTPQGGCSRFKFDPQKRLEQKPAAAPARRIIES